MSAVLTVIHFAATWYLVGLCWLVQRVQYPLMAGVGAEVAALIAEEAFASLDAPVRRLGGMDIPVPFSPPLEDAYRVGPAEIAAALREICNW